MGRKLGSKNSVIKDKNFECLSKMPPLYLQCPGEDFDLMDSPMIEWMIKQPGVRQYLINQAKKTEYLRYDPESHFWKGVNYGKAADKDTVLPADEETAGNNGTGKGYANRTWKAGVF